MESVWVNFFCILHCSSIHEEVLGVVSKVIGQKFARDCVGEMLKG